MTKQVCEKCGKEFEARGSWQKVCLDCYKAGGTAAKATTTSKASTTKASPTTTKGVVSAEMFRKAYDELVAEFSDIHEDVKEYLGGWTSTIVINRSK